MSWTGNVPPFADADTTACPVKQIVVSCGVDVHANNVGSVIVKINVSVQLTPGADSAITTVKFPGPVIKVSQIVSMWGRMTVLCWSRHL